MGDETNARVVGTNRDAATDRERKKMVDGDVVGLFDTGCRYIFAGPFCHPGKSQ